MNTSTSLQLETVFSKLEPNLNKIIEEFHENDEFVFVPNFLTPEMVKLIERESLKLNDFIHRSFIPKHKKGGSVSRDTLFENTSIFREIYESKSLLQAVCKITKENLELCPASDQHGCALYYYDQEGDFIGFHFDTSYYAGKRYTLLIGIVDESSCYLEYELFHKKDGVKIKKNRIKISPGSLALFNGDKLRHRITPAKKDDLRVVLTLEFVSDSSMNPFLKFVSNMKDSIAYFGFKNVFKSAGK